MGEFAELFGWLAVWGFTFEILNYIVKFVNKKYISKLPRDKQKIVDLYRKSMKFFIKYHKIAGVITIASAITHFVLMIIYERIRISGLIGIALMLLLLGLSLYGTFVNRNYKGKWLLLHRTLAFLLAMVTVTHLI